MQVYNWFVGLATISGFLYFLAGFGVSYATHYIRCKLKHSNTKVQWRTGGIAIGIFAITITSLQSQEAYQTASKTAIDARECQIQFSKALVSNRDLNAGDRGLDRMRDAATLKRAKQLTDIQNALGNGEAYLDAKVTVDNEYFASLTGIDRARVALDKERQNHPYPDPTCGK